MSPLWALLLAALVVVGVALARGARAHRLNRLRAAWGEPVVRSRRIEAIAASHFSRVAGAPDSGSLDDRSWADLNLDDVFAAIDRTGSTLGQHALYHRLRTSPLGDELDAFEALVNRMTDDEAARERAQLALSRLQDPHGYDVWWLASPDAVESHAWYRVFPLLTILPAAALAVSLFWAPGWAVFVTLVLLNVLVRYATDARVGAVARSVRQFAPLIATAEALGFLSGVEIDSIVAALRELTPPLARLKLVSRWVNGDPFMLSVSAQPLAVLLTEVVNVVYEYLNLAFLLDATGAYLAVTDLATRRGSFLQVVAAAGDVDAAIGVASYRASRSDWTRPRFVPPGAPARLDDLRHPLIEHAVPNSVILEAGAGLLVTGSNMSGKTTLLRTVGVNAVLAQTIHTCLAREYGAPEFRVLSAIGRSDDLLSGKSYYIAEVESLLSLVRASQDSTPCLFLLDELFRGTNAVERIAAGQAVLEQLVGEGSGARRHVALAATHDAELVELLRDRFAPYHFGDSVGSDGLEFDYRLRAGPATTRNAIALLRLHGAPETLLARALATASMLDRQRRVPAAEGT